MMNCYAGICCNHKIYICWEIGIKVTCYCIIMKNMLYIRCRVAVKSDGTYSNRYLLWKVSIWKFSEACIKFICIENATDFNTNIQTRFHSPHFARGCKQYMKADSNYLFYLEIECSFICRISPCCSRPALFI